MSKKKIKKLEAKLIKAKSLLFHLVYENDKAMPSITEQQWLSSPMREEVVNFIMENPNE